MQIGGHPAVFLDVDAREFFLFGATFNAQDTWLLFFLLTGVGFGLVYATALAGRVWCGWACPQTVFLEGVYRRIERLVEGPRERRLRRNAGPWNVEKVARKVAAHALYVVASLLVAHVFLSYFASLPRTFAMVRQSPAAHPEAFAWVVAMTALFYLNFAWFREQLCVVICPYGRLQSALLDEHSLVVGYDARRGEPRGKKGARGRGRLRRLQAVRRRVPDGHRHPQRDADGVPRLHGVHRRLRRRHGQAGPSARASSATTRRTGSRASRGASSASRIVLYTVLLVVGAVVAFVATRQAHRLRGDPAAPAGRAVHDGGGRGPQRAAAAPREQAVDRGDLPRGGRAGRRDDRGPADADGDGCPRSRTCACPLFLSVPRDRFQGDFPVRVRVVRTDDARDAVAGIGHVPRAVAMSALLVVSALLMGLLGSAHCVVMCGGVVAMTCSALPLARRRQLLAQLPYVLAYNAGRIASYAAAGAVAGAIGAGAGVVRARRACAARPAPRRGRADDRRRPLPRRMGAGPAVDGARGGARVAPHRAPRAQTGARADALAALALGLVWGWMPCGLVYAALAAP